jgi:hypothetical protein
MNGCVESTPWDGFIMVTIFVLPVLFTVWVAKRATKITEGEEKLRGDSSSGGENLCAQLPQGDDTP